MLFTIYEPGHLYYVHTIEAETKEKALEMFSCGEGNRLGELRYRSDEDPFIPNRHFVAYEEKIRQRSDKLGPTAADTHIVTVDPEHSQDVIVDQSDSPSSAVDQHNPIK